MHRIRSLIPLQAGGNALAMHVQPGFFVLDQICTRKEAVNMQIKTKTTAGRATFSLKCFKASTLPRPAFCMPTSMDSARFFRASKPLVFL